MKRFSFLKLLSPSAPGTRRTGLHSYSSSPVLLFYFLLFMPNRGLALLNWECLHSWHSRVLSQPTRSLPHHQPLLCEMPPLTAAHSPHSADHSCGHFCSAHELCVSPRPHRLSRDSQVCGGHMSSLLTCLPSCRYAIPPEHGKRLERLAIGRCLRPRAGAWAGQGGAGGVGRQQSSLPGFALCLGFNLWELQGVTVPFSCTLMIRSMVPLLGGLSLHGFRTECHYFKHPCFLVA